MNGNESGFLFVFVDGWLSCFVAVCSVVISFNEKPA